MLHGCRLQLSQSRGAVAGRAGVCPEEARGSPGWKPGLPCAAGPEGQARGPDGRFGEKPRRTERGPLASFASGFLPRPRGRSSGILGAPSHVSVSRPASSLLCLPVLRCPSAPKMASALQTLASLVEGGTEVGVAVPLAVPASGAPALLTTAQASWADEPAPRTWDFGVSVGCTCAESAAVDSGEVWGSPTRTGADRGHVGCAAGGAGRRLRPQEEGSLAPAGGAGLTLAEPPSMSPGCSHGGLVRRGILRGSSALPGRVAASLGSRGAVCGQAS